MQRRRILVTGATSGIGLALVERLNARHAIIATGRKPAQEALGLLPDGVTYLEAPMEDPDLAARQIAEGLLRSGWTKLDHAVLNAGTGFVTSDGTEDPAIVSLTLAVNLAAPVTLARTLFPWLEKAGGTLSLVGSVAHKGASAFPSYAASKAGLDAFARSLRVEWKGRVTVQVIHPGPTRTAMHAKAGYEPGRAAAVFTPAPVMAAMMERAIASGRSPVTLSFAARALHAVRPETRL